MNKHSAALAYELLCVSVFRNNGFLIEHCGRKGDKGVDFKGHWTISNGKTIPIIGMFSSSDEIQMPVIIKKNHLKFHTVAGRIAIAYILGFIIKLHYLYMQVNVNIIG